MDATSHILITIIERNKPVRGQGSSEGAVKRLRGPDGNRIHADTAADRIWCSAVLVSRYAAACFNRCPEQLFEKEYTGDGSQNGEVRLDIELHDDLQYVHETAQRELGMTIPGRNKKYMLMRALMTSKREVRGRKEAWRCAIATLQSKKRLLVLMTAVIVLFLGCL